MKQNPNLILFIFAISLFTSCKSKNDVAELHDQVMALHEETMSKMDSSMLLKSNLKKILFALDSSSPNRKDSIYANINRLQKANDAMMDWMHEYKDPEPGADHDKTLEYLKGQLAKIEAVKNQMRLSFSLANATLKNEKSTK